MKNQAIVIRKYGGSSVLKLENTEIDEPERNEILLRQIGIGVNYHDIYVRSGLYKTLDLPGIPGCEGVGIIEKKGSQVDHFEIGDKVVYIDKQYGSYSNYKLISQELAIKVPKNIKTELVASNYLRAMTVIMLLEHVANIVKDQWIIVTAASGGVGRMLCKWASLLGIKVIGMVSDLSKVYDKSNSGCESIFVYHDKNLHKKIMKLTDNRGVDFIYDSVGSSNLFELIDLLRNCGHVINYGQASGMIPSFSMSMLAQKSLTVSRPILFHYIEDREKYESISRGAFRILRNKAIDYPSIEMFPLKDAHKTHDILESRKGGGSLYLQPDF